MTTENVDLKLRDVLGLPSCVAFKLWNLCGLSAPLPVKMVSGTRALIRPASSDFDVFYEVFVKRVYDPPAEVDRESVQLVLDLGANVGFSNLFWLEIFPNVRVLTYEPHPTHVTLALQNLKINGATERVRIRDVAAGTADGEVMLASNGAESALVEDARDGIPIRVVDLFNELPSSRIDLLKIDIEGSEYALVSDPRFKHVRPRTVCMEAHAHPPWAKTTRAAIDFWAGYWRNAGYRVLLRKGILWGILV